VSFPEDIEIMVDVDYIDEESNSQKEKNAFAYTMTIVNMGDETVCLTGRRWLITHGNGRIEEVAGSGVVGQQPKIRPGEAFEYTSGSIIDGDVGAMTGHYDFITDGGTQFSAEIPRFILSAPRVLH